MDDKKILEDLIAEIKKTNPKFKIKYKNKSILQRILGLVLFFVPGYMTHYVTTMFGNVYYPSKEWVEKRPRAAWKILAHEYVHLLDEKEQGLKFKISYLAPQIYALGMLGAIGAFWNTWFLLFLGFAFFLKPGSKTRTKWELRGYAMSIAAELWSTGRVTSYFHEFVAKNFYGSAYYWMWRDKEVVFQELKGIELKLGKGDYSSTHPVAAAALKKVLEENGAFREAA